jgi:dethiobiotin synthetase
MPEVVVVSGTDTAVGKTWVTARLAEAMSRRGTKVAVRKPVQSFDPADGLTDAEILATASGDVPASVCPRHRWYETSLAPPMAAEALGRPPIRLRDLVDETDVPADAITLVEGVGGARSPVAADGDTVALTAALDAGVVLLVAPPGLGAINSVRLGASAFAPRPVIIYLNHFAATNETHVRNLEWLTEVDHFAVCSSIDELTAKVAARLATNPSQDQPGSAPMEV